VLFEDYWYFKRCICVCKFIKVTENFKWHKLNYTAIMYFDL